MEKIDEIEYKGFKTEFYVTKNVRNYLEEENINLEKLKQRSNKDNNNYSFFYEVLLFELLDKNSDGSPDRVFGKNFKVIYYLVAKRKRAYNIELERGIIEEVKDELSIKDEIGEGTKEISTNKDFLFEIKYKIIK